MAELENSKDLISVLWSGADILRSKMDANEYKDYLLGIVFYKYLSDSFLIKVYDLIYDEKPENLKVALEAYKEALEDSSAEELKEKAKHILDVQLSDTLKAHRLLEDGTYQKVDRRGKEAIEAQKTFCEEAIAAANESKKKVPKKRTFDPRFSPQEE